MVSPWCVDLLYSIHSALFILQHHLCFSITGKAGSSCESAFYWGVQSASEVGYGTVWRQHTAVRRMAWQGGKHLNAALFGGVTLCSKLQTLTLAKQPSPPVFCHSNWLFTQPEDWLYWFSCLWPNDHWATCALPCPLCAWGRWTAFCGHCIEGPSRYWVCLSPFFFKRCRSNVNKLHWSIGSAN